MMSNPLSEAWLHNEVCGLIDVTKTNQGFEVTLPQAYHTGLAVVVVVASEAGGFVVHDNGYAAMTLDSRGGRATGKMQERMRSSVESYGCRVEGFRVQRRVALPSEIGLAAVLVGCASRLIADEALRHDPAPVFDFKRSLIGRVTEKVGYKRIRENEEFAGSSGSTYKVGAVILDEGLSKPLAFVEAVADHSAVARRFREFYDFKDSAIIGDIERIAVYDDTKGEITASDILLLQRVSNPVRFRDTGQRFDSFQVH